MLIRRMQVEGGFLDGLDLRFEAGLNVLIGGRGTGKSSIIELIRYCLDVRGNTNDDDATRSREQALSVLQDGTVTLSIEHNGSDIDVSRSADASVDAVDNELSKPLIFSQTDVELVGMSVRGRLGIVDFFLADSTKQRLEEKKRATHIQSLTTEIRNFLQEADEIWDRIAGSELVRAELARAEARSAEASKTSKDLKSKQAQLETIATVSASLAVKADALHRALQAVTGYRDELSETQFFGFSLDEWPEGAGKPDLLQPVRKLVSQAEDHVVVARGHLETSITEIQKAIKSVERERAPLDEQARAIRKEIEGLKEGAGAAARQLASLREQITQLNALDALATQKVERAAKIQAQRNALLKQLNSLREKRSSERQQVARSLSAALRPHIRVAIRRTAQRGEFASAITNALRGSGLRYNELARDLAVAMTPSELVEAVEDYDVEKICKAVKISKERAQRIVDQLRTGGTESIVTVALDDLAEFELLDGTDYKPMESLSVGQRCTVVLSLLLQNSDRMLIVDQPEDHLDNAFIAETLIEAIRRRSRQGQLLFSTHNANIPVLGNASKIFRMASNGRRGFVLSAEGLDHPRSVEAITEIMEGGIEAFRVREKFYRRYTNE